MFSGTAGVGSTPGVGGVEGPPGGSGIAGTGAGSATVGAVGAADGVGRGASAGAMAGESPGVHESGRPGAGLGAAEREAAEARDARPLAADAERAEVRERGRPRDDDCARFTIKLIDRSESIDAWDAPGLLIVQKGEAERALSKGEAAREPSSPLAAAGGCGVGEGAGVPAADETAAAVAFAPTAPTLTVVKLMRRPEQLDWGRSAGGHIARDESTARPLAAAALAPDCCLRGLPTGRLPVAVAVPPEAARPRAGALFRGVRFLFPAEAVGGQRDFSAAATASRKMLGERSRSANDRLANKGE